MSKNTNIPVVNTAGNNFNPLFKLRNIILDEWRDDKKYFLGRVLTIIDASIADVQQRKAIKDLVEQAFYEVNYREQTVREALISFAKKFAEDAMPNQEEIDIYFSRCPSTTAENVPNYFSEYK